MHITIIGPLSPYDTFVIDLSSTVFKRVFVRYYLDSECIENNMLLLPTIIATVFDKWFSMAIT